jgi:hypothetical protein
MSLDRIDDSFVLGHNLVEHAGRPRCAKRCDAHETAKLTEERVEDRQLSPFGNGQMESLVELEELVVETCGGGASLLDDQKPEPIDLPERHDLARTADRDTLERFTQQLHLLAMVGRETPNDRLPSRPNLNQTLLQQTPEGLADRRSRASDAARELRFGEDGSGRQVAAQNAVSDVPVGPVGEPAASHG